LTESTSEIVLQMRKHAFFQEQHIDRF